MNIDKQLKKMLGKKSLTSNIFKKFNFKKFGGKNDWDFDGIPNKRDCQPRNTMRQDNQIYLKPTKRDYEKHPTLKRETHKMIVDDRPSMYGFSEVPNKVFIGFEMRDKDYNKEENIEHLSNVLAHEEVHNELSKHQGWKTSQQYDRITPSTIFVLDREGKEVILNPRSVGKPYIKRKERLNKFGDKARDLPIEEYNEEVEKIRQEEEDYE